MKAQALTISIPTGLDPTEARAVRKALKILEGRAKYDDALTSPDATRRYIQLKIATLDCEVFGMLFLDNRHRVIADEILFRGTIDGSSVHPREVVKAVLAHNAAAVIMYHNHPSGIAEPSHADERLTRKLRDALALIEVRTLDHLVVGADQAVSFAERGLL